MDLTTFSRSPDTMKSFQDVLQSLENLDLYGSSKGQCKRRIISDLETSTENPSPLNKSGHSFKSDCPSHEKSLLRKVNSLLSQHNYMLLPEDPELPEVLDTLYRVLVESKTSSALLRRYEKHIKTLQSQSSGESKAILDEVCRTLSLKSHTCVVGAIQKVEKVIRAVPPLEKFVKDVCEVVFPDLPDVKIEDIIPEISNSFQEFHELKQALSQRLALPLDFNTQDALDAINSDTEIVEHFCRIFEVSRENAFNTIDRVFLLAHELRAFLKVAKTQMKLPQDASVSSVLLQLKHLINFNHPI